VIALPPTLVFLSPVFSQIPFAFQGSNTSIYVVITRLFKPLFVAICFFMSQIVSGLLTIKVLNMARFSLASLPLNTLSSVPLGFFRAKVFSSAERVWGKTMALEVAYYVIQGSFGDLI
jgi:hypothetical protein